MSNKNPYYTKPTHKIEENKSRFSSLQLKSQHTIYSTLQRNIYMLHFDCQNNRIDCHFKIKVQSK